MFMKGGSRLQKLLSILAFTARLIFFTMFLASDAKTKREAYSTRTLAGKLSLRSVISNVSKSNIMKADAMNEEGSRKVSF